MKKSFHTYKQQVLRITSTGYASHMNDSCYTYINESCHAYTASFTTQKPRICGPASLRRNILLFCRYIQITQVNESRHTNDWVTSCYVNDSCHTHEYVMSRMDESCHIYGWHDSSMCAMTHAVTHVCATFMCSTHLYLWTQSPTHVATHTATQHCNTHYNTHCNDIHTCDVPHAYVCCDSFMCVKWIIQTCDMTRPCVTWLLRVRDVPRSYVRYNSSICVTRPIHTSDITHSNMWHDSFIHVTFLDHSSSISVTWLIHMCDMTHSYAWRDSFMFVTWLIFTYSINHFQTETPATAVDSWQIAVFG